MNKYNHLIISVIFSITSFVSLGQNNWSKILKENLTPKLFVETYFATDALNSNPNVMPDFIYNHKRLEEVGVNSAIIGFDFAYRRIRSSVSLIGGNYATYNIIEPDGLKNIYEANFGYKLLKHHDLWLDVGVMESNLGFESVISTANRTMTRSLLAEGSPYYLNAAKLGYTTFNKKWKFELLLSNGWQKMTNGNIALGHTLQFRPNDKWTINSSSFIGDRVYTYLNNQLYQTRDRFFHNFYIQRETDKTSITAGIDFGTDFINQGSTVHQWEAYILQFSYDLTEKISATIRGEYFFDPNEAVTTYSGVGGQELFAFSANFDFRLHEAILFRLEGKYLENSPPYYTIYPILYNGIPQEFLYIGTSLSIDLWNH